MLEALWGQKPRLAIWKALPAAVLLLTPAGCGGDKGPPPPRRLPVEIRILKKEDLVLERDYPGRVYGVREVEVRARVEGVIEKRLYTEGEVVEQDKPLFIIDRRPFVIAMNQAKANLEDAKANLNNARREWRRVSRMFAKKAASERERDSALSAFEAGQARFDRARAELNRAELDLEYAHVKAPVSGITSLEAFSEGNLIQYGTLLTTIVQHDPAHVRFALPEDDAALLEQTLPSKGSAGDKEPILRKARLTLPDGRPYPVTGTVDFAESTIDTETGTVTLRAVFPNPEGGLIPGQFVRVHVTLETFRDVVGVPEASIVQTQDGPAVFVVNSDEKARLTLVRLGAIVEGRQVILEGLSPGDRLVVNGHVNLKDGTPVSTVTPPESAA
jgi:membrane fusion protein (multidrug efflux system)